MSKKKRRNCVTLNSDFNSFIKKIDDCKFSLLESQFYQEVLSALKKSLEAINVGNVEQCICYGLGNISSSVISRYQFALLLLLRDHFKLNVDIFDPAFLPIELEHLVKLEIRVIDNNEEGLRKITTPTLMYMPHCPTALINNLLWSNWLPSLCNCVVFGNSFQLLSETLTKRDLKTKYRCIHSIFPVTSEFRFENDFKYSDIFNDLSLHVFPPSTLEKLPPEFWGNVEKPFYDDCDVECISKQLSNVNVNE